MNIDKLKEKFKEEKKLEFVGTISEEALEFALKVISKDITSTIKKREDKSHIGTLTRIYSYFNKALMQKNEKQKGEKDK